MKEDSSRRATRATKRESSSSVYSPSNEKMEGTFFSPIGDRALIIPFPGESFRPEIIEIGGELLEPIDVR